MRQRLTWLGLFGAATILTAILYAGNTWATTSSGFMPTTLAKGTLDEFEVFNQTILPSSPGDNGGEQLWLSLQKTKGSSDLYVQSNVWQPGGTTGWHTHPGHSLIIVTAGAVTNYESSDPACAPHVYTVGMSFVDAGGDNPHIVRNEGAVVAKAIAVQLIPAGATRRIDVPTIPANCPGIQ